MQHKILDQEYRFKIIQEIKGSENNGRKAESLRQVEIYNDRIYQHVWERLERNFSQSTLSEMPIIASINLARRIAKQEASIYKNAPKRSWSNLTDDQIEVVERIYKDMSIDSKMLKSNESFKLQNQNHVMVVPRKGKLCMRVLRNHHIDSMPDMADPETADAYVIASYDKQSFIRNRKKEKNSGSSLFDQMIDKDSDRMNQKIGDPEDYESETWSWWDGKYNFLTDGNGEIIGIQDTENIEAEIENPAEMLPIVDISIEKDFEYWVRQGESLTEFTIEYNAFWSNVMQIVMMQGFAQAYLKGPQDLIPDLLQIGPNYVLKLPVDPDNPSDIEFGYANPSPDLAGTNSSGDALLANFLTSRGLDPSLVSGKGTGQKFNSGTERLLAMIEMFEASKSDYDTYQRAEAQIWDVVRAWHNNLSQTDLLDDKYKTAELPMDAEISVLFSGPEMIQSEMDKLANIEKKVELGLMSTVDAIQELREVDRSAAEEIAKQIEEDEFANNEKRINENSGFNETTERDDEDPEG